MTQATTVYWIRRPEHTCYQTQGYIGITNDISHRMAQHKSSTEKTILNRAKNKYGWDGLKKDVLYIFETREKAMKEETRLRPDINIGWNILEGGTDGRGVEWYQNPDNMKRHKKAASDAQMKKTQEDRSAIAFKREAKRSPEARKAAAKKGKQTMGPEARKAAAKKRMETMGMIPRIRKAKLTHDDLSKICKKARASMTPEARSEAARKGWEKRRRKRII